MNAETPAEAVPATKIASTSEDAPAEPCVTCGQPMPAPSQSAPAIAASPPRFVYAVGRLRAEFPDTGVAHEFAQLTGVDSRAMVRTEDLKDALSRPESRYLVRHVCWVFHGPGGDVCTVHSLDRDDLDELLDLLASDDEDVVEALVGGPVAPTLVSSCTAPGLPAVTPDQVLRFTFDEFVRAMPVPHLEADEEDAYRKVVRDLFAQLTQRAGNLGVSDEHRALNMLALRYPQLYHLAFRVVRDGKALVGVDARSDIATGRRVVAVRLVFRDARSQLVERYHCTVDVTDLFPFLTSSLSQTFD
jgi:PatG C-terminal/PatG Domain